MWRRSSFRRLPARLVCDNLKTGVIRPDLYDPQINLAYGELASFYGTLIDPARAEQAQGQTAHRTPDAQHSGLVFRGRHFIHAQMQGEALRWCHESTGATNTRSTGNARVAVAAVERDALMPLPPRPFEAVTYTLGKVAPDCTSNPARRCTRCRGGCWANR